MGRTQDHLLPSEALPAIGDNSVVFHNGKGYYYTCRDYCLSPEQRVFSCVNYACEATASMGPGLGAPLIDNGYHSHNADLSYRDKCILLHTIKQRFIQEETLPSVILRDVLSSFQFEEATSYSQDGNNVPLEEHSLFHILKEEPSMEMEVQSDVIDEQQTEIEISKAEEVFSSPALCTKRKQEYSLETPSTTCSQLKKLEFIVEKPNESGQNIGSDFQYVLEDPNLNQPMDGRQISDGGLQVVRIQTPKAVAAAAQNKTQVIRVGQIEGVKNHHVCANAKLLSVLTVAKLKKHAHNTESKFQMVQKELEKIMDVLSSIQKVQQENLLEPKMTYEFEENFEDTQESLNGAQVQQELLEGEQEQEGYNMEQSLKPKSQRFRKTAQPIKTLEIDHQGELDHLYEAESTRVFEVQHEGEIPYEYLENVNEIYSEVDPSFTSSPLEEVEVVSNTDEVSVPDHIMESIFNPNVNLGRQRRHAITDKDGYMYCVNRKIGNKIYLRCSRFRQGCYARAVLKSGGQVVTQTNYSHNHRPDPHRVAIREFTAAIIAEVQNVLANQSENDTYRPLMDIYTEMVERYPNLAPHVSYQLVRRAVKRANLFYR